MQKWELELEAEECRRRALCYLGRPEAPILLHMAQEFDRLAEGGSAASRRRGDSSGEKRRPG